MSDVTPFVTRYSQRESRVKSQSPYRSDPARPCPTAKALGSSHIHDVAYVMRSHRRHEWMGEAR